MPHQKLVAIGSQFYVAHNNLTNVSRHVHLVTLGLIIQTENFKAAKSHDGRHHADQ